VFFDVAQKDHKFLMVFGLFMFELVEELFHFFNLNFLKLLFRFHLEVGGHLFIEFILKLVIILNHLFQLFIDFFGGVLLLVVSSHHLVQLPVFLWFQLP